jgi:hypothetical protein
MVFLSVLIMLVITLNTSPRARTTVRHHLSSMSEGIIQRLPGLEAKLRVVFAYLTIPHPLFRSLSWKIKSFMPSSLRTSESRLVQWAYEDMDLGLIEGGEEDVMVNGGRGMFKPGRPEDWEGLEMDEYIPLRSAREVEAAKDYGTRGRSSKFW